MSKEAMKHEINLVLTDPDSTLSHGARRALRYVLQSLEALAEQPAPPPECQTEAEKTAYAFGWFKALESVRKQPAQQEPVAWCSQCGHKCPPAQRTWVSLTDEDYLQALDEHPHEGSDRELWLVLEAKLKEKNT